MSGMKWFKRFFNDFGLYSRTHFAESSMAWDNVHALQLICTLSIAAALLFLANSFMNPGYARPLYRIVNITAFTVSTATLLSASRLEDRGRPSMRYFHTFIFCYILLLTFCGIVTAITDCINGGGFIVFLTSQVWIYDLLLIPPYLTVPLCGAGFAIFLGIASHTVVFPLIKYAEAWIFYITIIAANYFHYRNAVLKITREEMVLTDNEKLNRLSTTDELTGARNRMGLRVDFSNLSDASLFVMMCDIDKFKQYNDGYGHTAGDTVLRRFAAALSGVFGAEHVYRYGGDEFLVIVSEREEDKFLEKARRTARSFRRMGAGDMQPPTFSCGYVFGTCSGTEELRAMIREADAMLYEAKKSGPGNIRGRKMRD